MNEEQKARLLPKIDGFVSLYADAPAEEQQVALEAYRNKHGAEAAADAQRELAKAMKLTVVPRSQPRSHSSSALSQSSSASALARSQSSASPSPVTVLRRLPEPEPTETQRKLAAMYAAAAVVAPVVKVEPEPIPEAVRVEPEPDWKQTILNAAAVRVEAIPEPPKPEPVVKINELDDDVDEVPVPMPVAPGLLGELADFITASAMYPSEKFANATGVAVIGTLISQRIAGPTGARGTGTHLYQALVGPTGSGKEHIRTTGKLLLDVAGANKLIGPGRFKSGAGIVKYLEEHPVACCFMDELGAMFAQLADPRTSPVVRDVNEVLRELWGLSWGRYDSPAGANDKSKAVLCPALSLIGFTTPKELYRACKSRDVANGFLNRFMFVEEDTVPEYHKVLEGALDVPKSIADALKRLYQPTSLLDEKGKPSVRMTFGPGAEEVFDVERKSIEAETDDRKRELFLRSPEKIVRVATAIAAGRFAKAINREDMEWARDYIRASDDALFAGINEYMEGEKLEFSDLCREIMKRIKHENGEMTKRDLGRSFQGNIRFKPDLDRALDHLDETEQLIRTKISTRGRPSIVYAIPEQ